MDEKQPIIIKKKKGGHAAAHGGAWKVAYADFVTAMMCFFLVMWLMGSDEEVKAAIAHYFNQPNTPYEQGGDPESQSVYPLGDKEGSGDDILNGLDGLFPEDLIERAVKPVLTPEQKQRRMADEILDILEGDAFNVDVNPNFVRFAIPDSILFEKESSRLTSNAKYKLDKLAKLFNEFEGYITIEGHSNEVPVNSNHYLDNWQLSFSRAASVMSYFVQKHNVSEKKLFPVASAGKKSAASNATAEGRQRNRRVEIMLSLIKPAF